MQEDLNDMAVFAALVECGSFTAAAEHLGIGKSQVSQRLARLEKRLGMRLVQRTTRQQQVTEFGHGYYRHCRDMLDAAQRAQQMAEQATDRVKGSLRAVCPPLFSELILGPIVVDFMRAFPDVQLVIDQKYREVDVVREGYDLAIRIREQIGDSTLVARSIGKDGHVLVASPQLLRGRSPATPHELDSLPSLSMGAGAATGGCLWHLHDPQGGHYTHRHAPRLISDDLLMLREAATAGHGVVALPGFLCTEQLAHGELVLVLPAWSLPPVDLHVVYPSRQGQPPAVRAFIDFATPRIGARLDELHAQIAGDVPALQRSVAGHRLSASRARP